MVQRILGISGSARKRSYNSALLRAAAEQLSDGIDFEHVDISHFPLFNEDLEEDFPTDVLRFKGRIRAADAILIATPQYNRSVTPMLKNALDWGSRPLGDNSWKGKKVAIISASTGAGGGARSQRHLREILEALDVIAVQEPQVAVGKAPDKFSNDLRLIDPAVRESLDRLVRALLGSVVSHANPVEASTYESEVEAPVPMR